MTISAPLIELFVQEHQFRPWRGRLLTLGRQTILVDAARLQTLLTGYGIAWDPTLATYDSTTVQAVQAPGKEYVTDAAFFKSFAPEASLDVMDVTDYEGANLIHNLCEPVPKHFCETYDVIFNGSILDNIFDPAQALRNMSRMLKSGGRVIHIEMASNYAYEYLIYSTDWFIDYYTLNDFRDCRIYVCTFKDGDELMNGPWDVYAYMPKPDGDAYSLRQLGSQQAVVVVIAEKGESSRFDANPVQWCYRDATMKQKHNERLAKLDELRPVSNFAGHPSLNFGTVKKGGFHYCGRTS